MRRGPAHGLALSVTSALVLALAACGGDDSATPASAATESTVGAATATPANGGTATTGDPGAVCDSIPAIDEIAAIVGSPLSMVEDYSSPTVEIGGETVVSQRCEVSGDGIGMAIFERYDLTSGQATVDGLAGQGLVFDASWPDLPGATAWANGVMIEHDGLFLLATAITPATVGVLDAPEAYEASADLLRAWIR